MDAKRVWEFEIVKDCSAEVLTQRVNDGWMDHLMSFTPEGKLHVVFSRRIVPEPVKPSEAKAVVIAQPGSEEPVEKAQPSRSQRVLAAHMPELQARFEMRLRAGLAALEAIHPPWVRIPAAV